MESAHRHKNNWRHARWRAHTDTKEKLVEWTPTTESRVGYGYDSRNEMGRVRKWMWAGNGSLSQNFPEGAL